LRKLDFVYIRAIGCATHFEEDKGVFLSLKMILLLFEIFVSKLEKFPPLSLIIPAKPVERSIITYSTFRKDALFLERLSHKPS